METWHDRFLDDLDPVPWQAPDGSPTTILPHDLFVGRGEYGLQVALASSHRHPNNDDVRRLWHTRQRGGVSPLLLVVGFSEGGATKVKLCGPAGEQPVIVVTTVSQAERLARAALTEPSRHAAIRFLVAMLPEIDSDLPGVRNTGLVATHELRSGVPARSDWAQMTQVGKGLLTKGGRQLVEGLGFRVEQLGTTASVLAGSDGKRAVAVFLDEGESFDDPGVRFQGTSPVSHALALAERENLPWVLLTRNRQVRLYAARPDIGVGRKGRADTYLELNLALLPDDRAGYLPLLFGAKALAEQGTLEEILHSSERFAADLAGRLRERVYNECVPGLAEAIAARLDVDDEPTDDDLQHAYEQTLTALFRLLFVAYAEDKDLLPYRTNSKYADHSLKLISRRLAEDVAKGFDGWDEESIELWEDIKQLWRAVDRGNKSWGVPAYNGGLFSDAADVNPAGSALAEIELTDAELAPALAALLVDTNPSDGVTGPIDFRSLSVREFGTIYEGLLESMLSVASADLTLDSRGTFVPLTSKRDEVYVEAGAIYFHNRSGARKSTGSYFTKPFAVEHLLDHALEPALTAHIDRLRALVDAGDEAAAAAELFDFRCVDLAMGSGHFLTAAVDRIEARLSSFLALHPVPVVLAELDQLRGAALDALGELSDGVEIETTSLLRRQVARRCVYGIDLNPISVELARLAVWIHTFVPGLPLSFLDHNLVVGNSLTGIGTLDEVLDLLDPGHDPAAPSLFRSQIEDHLSGASEALRRLATITEATTADVKAARAEHEKALAAVRPASKLFDVLVAARLGETTVPVELSERSIDQAWTRADEGGSARSLGALHFPAAFPEVFLRDRPGFDVILGNPPWETLKAEEHKFWGQRYPGLRGVPTGEMNARIVKLRHERPDLASEFIEWQQRVDLTRRLLLQGPFSGLGSGDPDLCEVFAWRFTQLARRGGHVGVVLPRSVFMSAGTAEWRSMVLAGSSIRELVTLTNTGGWVFDDAEPRYTIALVTLKVGERHSHVRLRGPFRSLREYSGSDPAGVLVPTEQILEDTPGAGIPLLPNERSADVYRKLRAHPAWTAPGLPWSVRIYNELHATADKVVNGGVIHLDGRPTKDALPVYKGESINLWQPDTGTHYGWANVRAATAMLMEKRAKQVRNRRSPFYGLSERWAADRSTLPFKVPRIAWRMVARATDTRSFYAALIPPDVLCAHHLYLVQVDCDERERTEAYLLGVFCSIPFDWHARLWVEANFTGAVVQPFPVPAIGPDHPLRTRIEQSAGRLAAVDDRYALWAQAVGVEVASVVDPTEREHLVAEIDAAVALLYGLSDQDVRTIFETFHEGWDYRPRLALTLDKYRDLA